MIWETKMVEIESSNKGDNRIYIFPYEFIRWFNIWECQACGHFPLNIDTDGEYVYFDCDNCASCGAVKIGHIVNRSNKTSDIKLDIKNVHININIEKPGKLAIFSIKKMLAILKKVFRLNIKMSISEEKISKRQPKLLYKENKLCKSQ